MKTFLSDEGLSEVIGFILLIGILVIFLVMYQTYSVPVQGRDDEIGHMNDIKNTFVVYKISLDSLWMNEREGTMLSTTMDLGTGGGYSRGGAGEISLLAPVTSSGSVGLNKRDETIINVTGIKFNGDRFTYADFNPGALEYQSNNNYWIDQNYYYQLGGVFLEQDSGSTVRVMPPLNIVNISADPTGSLNNNWTAGFDFTIIRLFNEELISGTGPVRIDTNLKVNGFSEEEPEVFQIVSVSVKSDDTNTLRMWEKLFRDSLVRYNIDETWYTITNDNDEVVTLNVMGNPSHGVHTNIIRANYLVTLQTVATGIE